MALNEAQKKERSEYLEKYLKITECSQRKPYVFISYASDNWETVFKTAVVPMQQKYGLRVYADKAFDKVNDKWIVPMLRNIRGADVVVAFVSQSYIESYACFLELLTAVNNRKQIVFITLDQQLRLGDTTDQPEVERGVKNEILNQGANIATNTNNTSNDIMRAMKSAYTSISTLLEQDALSKYDISDAFINFFRDAAINRKTLNDLNAVRGTICSISESVFDPSLVASAPEKEEPKPAPFRRPEPAPAQEAEPVEPDEAAAEPVQAEAPVRQAVLEPEPEPVPVQESTPEPPPVWEFGPEENEGKKLGFKKPKPQTPEDGTAKKSKKKLVLCAVGAVVIIILLLTMYGGGTRNVENYDYTTPHDASGKYTGQLVNGLAEGQGTMVFENGNVYEGTWVDGNPNGQGTCTYSGGDTYTGGMKDGQPTGEGVYTWADGDVLEATFADDGGPTGMAKVTSKDGDVFEGDFQTDGTATGVCTYANGDRYEGEWFWTYPEGKGAMSYADGDYYEGEFSDGLPNGAGVLTYSDGSIYEGTFVDGLKDGEGVFIDTDGTQIAQTWTDSVPSMRMTLSDGVYTGTFSSELKPNGTGTMNYNNGQVYVGEWKDGVREGHGRCTWPDGGYYDGEWVNDRWNGKGTNYIGGSENVDFYVGDYVDGKREGYGVYTWAGGKRVFEGEWSGGKINGKGTMTDSKGNVFEGTWVDGQRDGDGVYTKADGTVVKEVWDHGTKIS